jgi:hypothetical protein
MPHPEHSTAPVILFYSYSHKDEALREKLETHLSLLQDQGVIRGWHDRRIAAGTEWDGTISENLDRADVILLLVSADFIASKYCRDVEVARAMERHEAGSARVIPVILRPVDWHTAPFGRLQALPRDGKPVTTWKNRDEAFADVARGIRECVHGLGRDVSPDSTRPSKSRFDQNASTVTGYGAKGYEPSAWEKGAAYAAALLTVLLVGFLTIRNEPFSDPNVVVLVRIILSLAVSVLGATVPGFLQVDLSWRGWAVRSGGALALFLVTFFGTPRVLSSAPPQAQPAIQPKPLGGRMIVIPR